MAGHSFHKSYRAWLLKKFKIHPSLMLMAFFSGGQLWLGLHGRFPRLVTLIPSTPNLDWHKDPSISNRIHPVGLFQTSLGNTASGRLTAHEVQRLTLFRIHCFVWLVIEIPQWIIIAAIKHKRLWKNLGDISEETKNSRNHFNTPLQTQQQL